MTDVLVVGGGVIGLSIAYELAGEGVTVRLLDQNDFGREASWAGAGILPPGQSVGATTSEAQLRGASYRLWPAWSSQLREETKIDNGFHTCGGIALRLNEDSAAQANEIAFWTSEGVEVEQFSRQELADFEPALTTETAGGYYLPELSQVRNPRHLKALVAGCEGRGVELYANTPVIRFEKKHNRILSVQTPDATFHADKFCVAAGAWTQRLLAPLGMSLSVEPIRGQIVLLQTNVNQFHRVIEIGSQYLVPRLDGRVLVGSTEERAGFHKANTADGVAGLLQLAVRAVPELASASIERCWSGLRPASADRLPYLDQLPETENLFIAAGHFRSGLQMSPATAVFMRELVLGQETSIDRRAFACDR